MFYCFIITIQCIQFFVVFTPMNVGNNSVSAVQDEESRASNMSSTSASASASATPKVKKFTKDLLIDERFVGYEVVVLSIVLIRYKIFFDLKTQKTRYGRNHF